jgi:hypothetical protein
MYVITKMVPKTPAVYSNENQSIIFNLLCIILANHAAVLDAVEVLAGAQAGEDIMVVVVKFRAFGYRHRMVCSTYWKFIRHRTPSRISP